MIVYFDTSALVPLVVDEAGSSLATVLWRTAETRVTARVTHVEAAAALGLAHRVGRINTGQLRTALRSVRELLEQTHVVEVTADLVGRAVAVAVSEGLRGYDALHCAAALHVWSPRTVAATGDRDLLAAWLRLGMATADTGQRGDRT